MGIGPGRELDWLCKIKSIKEIVGVDYSKPMLEICKQNAEKCEKPVKLIEDNFFSLKKLKKYVRDLKFPIFYLFLLNTLGNFSASNRIKILKTLKPLLKKEDRVICCLYKIPERLKLTKRIKLPVPIKIKTIEDKRRLSIVLEYALYDVLWVYSLKKGSVPIFWYDNKTNDVVVYLKGRKIFFSHRFSKEEINNMFRKAGMKIEEIKEGKTMWVVIAKF